MVTHLSSDQAVERQRGSEQVGADGGPCGHRKRHRAHSPTLEGWVRPEDGGFIESHGQGSGLLSAWRCGTLPPSGLSDVPNTNIPYLPVLGKGFLLLDHFLQSSVLVPNTVGGYHPRVCPLYARACHL